MVSAVSVVACTGTRCVADWKKAIFTPDGGFRRNMRDASAYFEGVILCCK
jgi:hypothetical protein